MQSKKKMRCIYVCVCACIFLYVLECVNGLVQVLLMMDKEDEAIALPGGLICMFVTCCFLKLAYHR